MSKNMLAQYDYSYFSLPSSAFTTPPLFYLNFSTPAAPETGALGWRENMLHDGAPTESSAPAALFPPGRASNSPFSQRPSASVFGVDPPRPPREGYE